MIQSISAKSLNRPQQQNINFNGQLDLIVKKTMYRSGSHSAEITIKNVRKAHPQVLGQNDPFVRSIYQIAKQFVKLVPDEMKLFFNVTHSKGKSSLENFSYQIGKNKRSKNFIGSYNFADALNKEAKLRGLYSKTNKSAQVEKFTNTLDEKAFYFKSRVTRESGDIIDVDALAASKIKTTKLLLPKEQQVENLIKTLKSLGLPESLIESRVAKLIAKS